MINKYLYVKGGSETYMIEIGNELEKAGNKVYFFGLRDEKNIVGNPLNLYAKFNLFNINCIFYNKSNFKKVDMLIKKLHIDIIHLNNINYQLSTSVIDAAIVNNVPVFRTIHDPQLVCPNHRLYIENKHLICEKCINGDFKNCIKNKCIKSSYFLSYLGYRESLFNHRRNIYNNGMITYITPSEFMKNEISHLITHNEIITITNYTKKKYTSNSKKICDYILYFGRLSKEKGIMTLLKSIPDNIKIKLAGTGPLENEVKESGRNVEYLGFLTGKELEEQILNAKFTIYPSEWLENCPFSILESLSLGTPVLASNIGGIPELINDGETGLLFKSGDSLDLKDKITQLYFDDKILNRMRENIKNNKIITIDEYVERLVKLYEHEGLRK